MSHRQYSPFNTFAVSQGANQNPTTAEQSYIPIGTAVGPENGSAVISTDNMSRNGMNCDSHWNMESRGRGHSFPSFGMEISHAPPAFSAPPYIYQHTSGNLCLTPENSAGNYNGPVISESQNGMPVPTAGIGRAPFKRKGLDISGACQGGSSSRFHGAESSSGSSGAQFKKPASVYHNTGAIGTPMYRASCLSISGEDSSRNVRSRSRLDVIPNAMRTHLSNHSSNQPYPSAIHQTNHMGIVDSTNFNADVATPEWSSFPVPAASAHGRVPNSDMNCSRHDAANQFQVGASAAETASHHHDSSSRWSPFLSSQYHHGPPQPAREACCNYSEMPIPLNPPVWPARYHHVPPQPAREGCSNYSEVAIPSNSSGPTYSDFGHEAASSSSVMHSLPENLSPRYSRPLSAGGWQSSNRSGRLRVITQRFQSISNVLDDHDRMRYEAPLIVDQLSYHGGPRNSFDQYRDMRLDIDSMSYEELIALGERIGNVNTGLSEDMITECLMESVHYTSNQNKEEEACTVCLEEYENEEEVGTLKHCGHVYHVSCIKKWLFMKNICPICKATAHTE